MDRSKLVVCWFSVVIAFRISLVLAVDTHLPTALPFNKRPSPLCYNDSLNMMVLDGLNMNMDSFAPSAGLFDLCLSVESPYSFQGQYCSAFFKVEKSILDSIKEPNLNSSKVVVKEENGDSRTYGLPRVGFCIPSSCSPIDFRSSIAQLITQNMVHHDGHGNQSVMVVTIITDGNYCFIKKKIDSVPKFDGPDIAVIFVFSLLGLVILAAALYDFWRWHSNRSQTVDTYFMKILHCFSVIENARKVLSTKVSPSDLPCLNGIRVLSATWIVLFHSFFFITDQQMSNHLGPGRNVPIDFISQAITRAPLAVDTFFMLSGLLVSYTFMRDMKQNDGRFNLLSFYLHRYARIAPFYALYFGFIATVLVYLGSGPLWTIVNETSESCRSNWWAHFLFLKNYFMKNSCMGQAWYLAVDMQFFILSPVFLYPVWRWRKVGLIWIILALTALVTTMITIFVLWSLPVPNFSFERPIEANKTQYRGYYYQTWPRLPQYLVGIILGWLITLKTNEPRRLNLNWIGVSCGWILSLTTILLVLYGIFPFLDEVLVPELDPFVRVTYGALNRFGWAVAVGWTIFACLNGYGGFINTFLSWKGFMPLGRLTFIVYLIGTSRMPLFYTKLDLMLNYLLVLVVSFVLAFFLKISIEMPFINIGRVFVNSKGRNNALKRSSEKVDDRLQQQA